MTRLNKTISKETKTFGLSYIHVPRKLWKKFTFHQYIRFKYVISLGLFSTAVLYFFFSYLINYHFPELFIKDVIARVFIGLFFFTLYISFYYKKENMEILDFLIMLFCMFTSIHWMLLFLGNYNYQTTYQLTIAGAPVMFLCGFIQTRFRYALISAFSLLTCIIVVFINTTHKTIDSILIDFLYIVVPIMSFSLFVCWNHIRISRLDFLKKNYFSHEKSRLIEDNQNLLNEVYTDGLTKIGNRRQFEEIISNIFNERKELELFKIAILLIDVDFFKLYNDNYGHLAGDNVLYELSQRMKKTCKDYNAEIYRYGGEEFIVCQRYNDIYEVSNLSRALIAGIFELNIEHSYRKDNKHCITISIGCSHTDETYFDNVSQMIHLADTKLYEAKKNRATFII